MSTHPSSMYDECWGVGIGLIAGAKGPVTASTSSSTSSSSSSVSTGGTSSSSLGGSVGVGENASTIEELVALANVSSIHTPHHPRFITGHFVHSGCVDMNVQSGDAKAQHAMGVLCILGQGGVERSEDKAMVTHEERTRRGRTKEERKLTRESVNRIGSRRLLKLVMLNRNSIWLPCCPLKEEIK